MCCRASFRRFAMAVADSLFKRMVGSSLGSEKAGRESLGVSTLADQKKIFTCNVFYTSV